MSESGSHPDPVDDHDPPPGHFPRRTIARVRRDLARARARLERERERRYLVALGYLIVDRSQRTAASVLAGALAFRFFLTILPLALVLVVGLGYLKSASESSTVMSEFGIRGVIAHTISHSVTISNPGRTIILVLGVFGLLSGARTTARTLRAIHALAWGIPVRRWHRNGSAGLVFLGGVIVMLALAGIASRVRSAEGIAIGFGASVGIAAGYSALWLGASVLMPHAEGIGWKGLVPGAVLVGIGVAALQVVTANTIGPRVHHTSELYGSLGVAFVVLLWLYLLGRLLVAAPLLNAAVAEHRGTWVKPPRGALFGGSAGGESASLAEELSAAVEPSGAPGAESQPSQSGGGEVGRH